MTSSACWRLLLYMSLWRTIMRLQEFIHFDERAGNDLTTGSNSLRKTLNLNKFKGKCSKSKTIMRRKTSSWLTQRTVPECNDTMKNKDNLSSPLMSIETERHFSKNSDIYPHVARAFFQQQEILKSFEKMLTYRFAIIRWDYLLPIELPYCKYSNINLLNKSLLWNLIWKKSCNQVIILQCK